MTTRRELLTLGCGLAAFGGQPVRAAAPMLTRPIPSSGERLPLIGLGTYIAFDIGPGHPEWNAAGAALAGFVRNGGRLVDSSPMYGEAEAAVGALARKAGVNGKLFTASKIWTRGRQAGLDQVRASMRRFGVARMDLMQVHNLLDAEVHLRTLAAERAAGRVRYLGVTHYHSGAYGELERVMRAHRLDFVQVNYSAQEREAERRILPLARERGVAVIVNRPFAGGGLFGRLRGRRLPRWAGEIGCASWAQLLLKFVVSHPAVNCAIPGSRNPRHVLDNIGGGRGPLADGAMRARIAAAIGG